MEQFNALEDAIECIRKDFVIKGLFVRNLCDLAERDVRVDFNDLTVGNFIMESCTNIYAQLHLGETTHFQFQFASMREALEGGKDPLSRFMSVMETYALLENGVSAPTIYSFNQVHDRKQILEDIMAIMNAF